MALPLEHRYVDNLMKKSISMSDEAAIVRKALVVIALSVIAAILLRVFAGRV